MKLTAQFFDDGEYWFFEADTVDRHDPTSGAFVVEVPDELAVAYLEAVATTYRLAEEIPALVGLARDAGQLLEVCSAFETSAPRSSYTVTDFRRCEVCGGYAIAHAVVPA